MRLRILLLLFILFPSGAFGEDLLTVKYRSSSVDVDKPYFEVLDTSESSWIGGAWYDEGNQYMIINLNGTNYHHCGLLKEVWRGLKRASSFGSYYTKQIRGKYDCREHRVPEYEE